MRRGAVRLAGWLASLAALAFVAIRLRDHADVARELLSRPRGAASLAAAAVLVVSAHATTGLAWHSLLRACGASVTRVFAVATNLRVQLAKYLPGNVAHHAGRVMIARARGIPMATAGTTLGLEAIAMAIVGLGVALAGGGELARVRGLFPSARVEASIALALLVGAIAVAARFGKIRALRSVRLFDPAVAGALGVYVVGFALLGAAVRVVAGALGVHDLSAGAATGAFALAWVAGFVTPGAPAGIGVRETVLVLGLAPLVGEAPAVGIAAAMRLASIAADACASLVGFAMGATFSSACAAAPQSAQADALGFETARAVTAITPAHLDAREIS